MLGVGAAPNLLRDSTAGYLHWRSTWTGLLWLFMRRAVPSGFVSSDDYHRLQAAFFFFPPWRCRWDGM